MSANPDLELISNLAGELAECGTELERLGIVEYGDDRKISIVKGIRKLIEMAKEQGAEF